MKKVKTMTLEELAQRNRRLDFLYGKTVNGLTALSDAEAKKAQKEIKALEKAMLTHLTHSVKTEKGIQAMEEILSNYQTGIRSKETGHYDMAKAYAHLAIDMSALGQTKDVAKANKLVDEEVRDENGNLNFNCSSHSNRIFQENAAKILQADGLELTGLDKEQE